MASAAELTSKLSGLVAAARATMDKIVAGDKTISDFERERAARHMAMVGAGLAVSELKASQGPFAAGLLGDGRAVACWDNHFHVAENMDELCTSDMEKTVVLNGHERTLVQFGVKQ